jgi:AraC family transcriptional regulator, transcriptional activator of pobA
MSSQRVKTIYQYHQFMELPKPAHPLISLIDLAAIKRLPPIGKTSFTLDFYCISLKKDCAGKLKYGQQNYDFDEGIFHFMSPNQVLSIEIEAGARIEHSGYLLLIHPDFLWNTNLAKTIKQYEFFNYSVNEALFLSEKEEATIVTILKNMEHEYHANIDKFSQDVIIAQLELLLKYADRFYHRQFITRKIANHSILARLEALLDDYFDKNDSKKEGLPTVQFVAQSLNVSTSYLSGLLKTLTGQSAQQHIHEKLIEKAKEKLSTTQLSVSEIAFELGFEHSQSFSKLFKVKTKLSPIAFRAAFN